MMLSILSSNDMFYVCVLSVLYDSWISIDLTVSIKTTTTTTTITSIVYYYRNIEYSDICCWQFSTYDDFHIYIYLHLSIVISQVDHQK